MNASIHGSLWFANVTLNASAALNAGLILDPPNLCKSYQGFANIFSGLFWRYLFYGVRNSYCWFTFSYLLLLLVVVFNLFTKLFLCAFAKGLAFSFFQISQKCSACPEFLALVLNQLEPAAQNRCGKLSVTERLGLVRLVRGGFRCARAPQIERQQLHRSRDTTQPATQQHKNTTQLTTKYNPAHNATQHNHHGHTTTQPGSSYRETQPGRADAEGGNKQKNVWSKLSTYQASR